MFSDLRFAFRQLTKSPGFTGIAVLTLALGIGLNTSMFSLMNLLILRPLPYPDKDHLARLYRTTTQSQTAEHSVSDYEEIVRGAGDFAQVAAFRLWGYSFAPVGRPAVNLTGARVSASFFPILGVQPELGRFFTEDEDRPGNHVMILSQATWQAQFGGDPTVIGRSIRIDGEPTTIVGVLPAAFSSVFLWGPGDVFRPLALTDAEKNDRAGYNLSLIARSRPGDSLAQLNSRLATLAARLAPLRPAANSKDGLRAVTLQSLVQNPNLVTVMLLLLGLAGFVLLIVCANLANLQLARAVARTHEFAIRAALGASRRRLLGPLIAESILLSLAGGSAGLLIALWTNDWVSSQMSANGFVVFKLALDWQALGFALFVSLLAALVFGLVPAWLTSRVNVNETLKSGGRSGTGDHTQKYFRSTLIVAQFALALTLLAGASFFVRGLDRMLDSDPGWDTNRMLMAVVNLPASKYPNPAQTYLFHTRLQERLQSLPGVEDAGVAWTLPIFQYLTNRNFVVEGREAPPVGHEPLASVNAVTPSYLDTVQTKLLSGRNFTAADNPSSPRVALINQTMARNLFPHANPIGQHLGATDPAKRDWLEIVGVVADQQFAVSFNAPATRDLVLIPLAQESWNYVTIAVRSRSPEALVEPMRKAIAELDPDLPLQQFGTVRQIIAQFASSSRMIGNILIVFAALGLFLAALGLYGVIARLVVQRTPEIGVRVALGAQGRDVMRLILVAGLKLTLLGTAFGLFGSYGLAQLLAKASPSMGAAAAKNPYEIPVVLLGTVALLVSVALLACWLPARRAARVDPMVALRSE